MKRNNQIALVIVLLVIVMILSLVVYFYFEEKNPNGGDLIEKIYLSQNLEECALIRYRCEEGFHPFVDEAGCGCTKEKISTETRNFCTQESRNAEACTTIYSPVCGWFDPEKIQCIRYPCAQIFSNSCLACIDKQVLYWTSGECPQ